MGLGKDRPVELYPCRDWGALLDPRHPGMRLIVTGRRTIATPGYATVLRSRESGPAEHLLLKLQVRQPTDPVPDVLDEVEVRYEKVTTTKDQTATVLGYASMPTPPVH